MKMLNTILITNDTSIAVDAQVAGVARIMVDLESHGKKERQASRSTYISNHVMSDVVAIRAVLSSAQMIVRINPWHDGSHAEIEEVLQGGPDIVMLPMITKMEQFENFIDCVAGRARILPLIETAYSMAHIAGIAEHASVQEVYIGLNDLHLSLGLDFLFEPLAVGLVDWMAAQIVKQGKVFGFGGIGMMGGAGELPAERILGEHVRLGSSSVILSSRFCKDIDIHNADGRAARIQRALLDLQAQQVVLAQRTPAVQEADYGVIRDLILRLARRT